MLLIEKESEFLGWEKKAEHRAQAQEHDFLRSRHFSKEDRNDRNDNGKKSRSKGNA